MKPDDEKPEHDVQAEKELAAKTQARRLDLGHELAGEGKATNSMAEAGAALPRGVGVNDRVLYFPDRTETIRAMPGQPLAAFVCYAHSQVMVNLAVFDINGSHHTRTSVVLVRRGDPKPDFSHAVL